MFTGRGTANRQKVYEFIRSWAEKNGYPPSIREICAGVGLASTKAVKYHLDALVANGMLKRHARHARALELSGQPFSLPLVGRIAAGQPVLAIENIEESISLNRFRDCFMLRVKGDSMTGAGILNSDMVIVQPQEVARSGDVVVAMVDNEATVKRFFRDGKSISLVSENPKYPPILVESDRKEFRILGVVVGLLRRYS